MVNKIIWEMPKFIHNVILFITGWRLVGLVEIVDFDVTCTSLDGTFYGIGGKIKEKSLVLEWHKEYPTNAKLFVSTKKPIKRYY